ncbi:MAG: apolipoprotein N-acyltransferase [Actinomycetota bacterium]|jgi:apolipoprotein N-acyltransferase
MNRLRFWHKVAVAALAGICLAMVFPPVNFPWVLAILVFILWLELIRSTNNLRQAAGIGLFFGLGFFLPLLNWIKIVGQDAWFALAILCTFWWIVASIGSRIVLELRWWPLLIPAIWTTAELLRDRFPFGGFGWGQIGVITPNTPFRSFAPIVGQLGMTVFFVGAACAISWLITHRVPVQTKSLYAVGALAATSVLSFTPVISQVTTPVVGSQTVTLGMVQGGVDHYGLGIVGDPRKVLMRHAAVSESNAVQLREANLIVWPENSADVDPTLDQQSAEILDEIQTSLDVPILLGAIRNTDQNTRMNIALLWQNGQWDQVYQKRRLVPFGEFLPGRDFISQYTDRVDLMPRDFEPGFTPGSLTINGVNLGVLICFEGADDWQGLEASQTNSVILIQTNNATFQNLGQSEQQLQSAQMRAIETQRPVVVISTSGISAIVDAKGVIVDQLTQAEVGVMIRTFPNVTGVSPAVTAHHLIIAIVASLSVFGIIAGLYTRRKVTL